MSNINNLVEDNIGKPLSLRRLITKKNLKLAFHIDIAIEIR
jgi:hypothetical protein